MNHATLTSMDVTSSCCAVSPTNASRSLIRRRSISSGVAEVPAFSTLRIRYSPYSSPVLFMASTSPSVKIASQSPGSSVTVPDSYGASALIPRGRPPFDKYSRARPELRNKIGGLCPALIYVRAREEGVNSARKAVVNRNPFWLFEQAYRFMPLTSSAREHGVSDSVLRLA